jgi:hypothetical protein
MLFSKEELPIASFSLLGINWQDAAQMLPSELLLLLKGRRTSLLPCKPILPGESKNLSLRARLSLSRDSEGKAILKFHPSAKEPENGFGLAPAQVLELKAHPETPLLVVEGDQLFSVYLDPQTNELVGLNFDALRAPLAINGRALTEEQEMRFKLGETISISNPDGAKTVFRLDPFQPSGITGWNLDSLEIELDGALVSLQYRGRLLIDNDYLLQHELGGLIILEEALKQRLIETHPDLMLDLEQALVEAKEEILHYKVSHAGQISSDEISAILSMHLSGIPFSSSLESLISSEKTFFENNLSDETGEEGSEKIHWLASYKNIDGTDMMMLELAMGATLIGILSTEEQEKISFAIKQMQETLESNKEVLSPIQLQEKMLALLHEQLGPRLAVYQKDSQLKVSQTPPPQKQQPNISQ